MAVANIMPKLQANFFWTAPIGRADCFQTKSLAINIVGENLGFIKMPMAKLANRNHLFDSTKKG
jgi:hypothetical protein